MYHQNESGDRNTLLERLKELKNQQHVASLGQDTENRYKSSSCMVEMRLKTNPIEELKTLENIIIVVVVMEDIKNKGFR